jgi:5'(3')-deoxyribonucleotidase
MRKSIAIDMDQVIANMYKKLAVSYNELFGANMTEEEFLNAPQDSLSKEQFKLLLGKANDPDYYRDMELMDPDAVEVIRELNEHFDIYIATAAMEVPGSFNAKYDWLREHFPFLDTQKFVFCGTKAVIHTDYLIDDSLNQLQVFSGQGILYSMPYNKHVEGYPRVENWKEVREFFLSVTK